MSDQETAPPEAGVAAQPGQDGPVAGVAPASEPSAGARRYPRTFGGLIASMLVLVLALVGFRFVQDVTHDSVPDNNMVVANWKGDVAQVQTVADPVYPGAVPAGWSVTSADWVPGTKPLWKLGLVTPDSQFVGIYQQQAPVAGLVAQTASKGGSRRTGTATISTPVGSTWTAWTDAGGDHTYATTVGKTTLVVYGTDEADVRTFMGLLTTKKLPKRFLNQA